MTCIVHSLVEDSDNQYTAVILLDIEYYMSSDMMGTESGIDFIIWITGTIRSASHFIHACFQ